MASCPRFIALAAALCLPSLRAFTPTCTLKSHSRGAPVLASLNDEPSKLSRRAVFTALSGAAGLAATLATAPPATAAGPLGGIAAALGLGGGVTPFGPVPKQGATSPSGVTTYDYLVGPGPTPNYGQVVRIEWVRHRQSCCSSQA